MRYLQPLYVDLTTNLTMNRLTAACGLISGYQNCVSLHLGKLIVKKLIVGFFCAHFWVNPFLKKRKRLT